MSFTTSARVTNFAREAGLRSRNARSIVDVENVEGLVREYWAEAVERLPG